MQNLPNTLFNSIDDFIIAEDSKPLGSGSFGVVKKAWHKMTNKIYAIKIISLDQNVNQPEILLLSREISIHYQLNHPHIVKLWAVLQQNDKIYMIMDYAENGNLFNYLNRKKVFTEAQSFKIFYQVLDAIEYMHKFDVFHRDIKPQNILLDHQLNVKLCDFGWVADQISRKRTTFCGTYQYMAPQMVKDVPYNYKIDIWALGILLYELNHGRAPFPAQSASVIKQRFQKGVYQIKQTLSTQIKYLIVGILQFQPSKRFQIEDIKQSDWVQKFKNYYCQSIAMSSILRSLPVNQTQHNRSNSGTLKVIGKQQKNIDESRQKKYRKKYRTLQQQDLYCMTQNLKLTKHSSIKDPQRTLECNKQNQMKQTFTKQKYSKQANMFMKQKDKEKDKQRDKEKQKQKKEGELKKKKIGGTRTHQRTGTETSELLHKKLSKIIFQQKLKIFTDDKKKKQASKRN